MDKKGDLLAQSFVRWPHTRTPSEAEPPNTCKGTSPTNSVPDPITTSPTLFGRVVEDQGWKSLH